MTEQLRATEEQMGEPPFEPVPLFFLPAPRPQALREGGWLIPCSQSWLSGTFVCSTQVPEGRVLKAGISVLGKHLGPPQHQGFLYQSGLRRWCVLVNGKLYEYLSPVAGELL